MYRVELPRLPALPFEAPQSGAQIVLHYYCLDCFAAVVVVVRVAGCAVVVVAGVGSDLKARHVVVVGQHRLVQVESRPGSRAVATGG